jgi:hypothetical protein
VRSARPSMASPPGGQSRLMFFYFQRRAARTAAPRVDRTRFCPLPALVHCAIGSRDEPRPVPKAAAVVFGFVYINVAEGFG